MCEYCTDLVSMWLLVLRVRDVCTAPMYCRAHEEHRESVVRDGVEGGAVLVMGQQLDFLNKELERLQVPPLTLKCHVHCMYI